MERHEIKLQYPLLGEGLTVLAYSRRQNDHRESPFQSEQALTSSHLWEYCNVTPFMSKREKKPVGPSLLLLICFSVT